MSESLTIELSEIEFAELVELAKKNGVSPEEQAKQILSDHFNADGATDRQQVSIGFLRNNVDAVLSAANQGTVQIRTPDGRVFVILTKERFDLLSKSE